MSTILSYSNLYIHKIIYVNVCFKKNINKNKKLGKRTSNHLKNTKDILPRFKHECHHSLKKRTTTKSISL